MSIKNLTFHPGMNFQSLQSIRKASEPKNSGSIPRAGTGASLLNTSSFICVYPKKMNQGKHKLLKFLTSVLKSETAVGAAFFITLISYKYSKDRIYRNNI